MSLIQSSSNKARQKNIETEIEAGKDPKQAVAIAYSVQRENDAELRDVKVSSNEFGMAIMYGPSNKEELERLAKAREKVYLEYEVNGKRRGFWKAASSLLRQLNSGALKIYDSAIKDIDGRLLPQSAKERKRDGLKKVENIGKFTLWKDETDNYYLDATINRSGKTLHPLGTSDINNARKKVHEYLSFIEDNNSIKDDLPYHVYVNNKYFNRYDSLMDAIGVLNEYKKQHIKAYIKQGDKIIKTTDRGNKMKDYKVKYKDRTFIVSATSEKNAVTKLLDSMKNKSIKDESNVYKSSIFRIIEKFPNGYGVAQTYDDDLFYVFDKNGKVLYGSYAFKNDAIEEARKMKDNTISDDGTLIEKYEKKVNGKPVTSAIIKHPRGFTFISGIVKEDKDFDSIDEIRTYAKKLGYNKTSDSKVNDESDLQLLRNYYKEKQPSRKMEMRTKLKGMGLKEGVSGVNSNSEMWVELNGKRYAVKNLSASPNVSSLDNKCKDTLEVLETDKYKITLDGSWLEITDRNGKEVYSGNTTVKSVREAYDKAKKQRIIDNKQFVKDNDYEQPKYKNGQKFEHNGKRYEIVGTKEVVADYITGRKGIVYEFKDISNNQKFTQPFWQLEKYVINGSYKLKDSKTFKITYKDKTLNDSIIGKKVKVYPRDKRMEKYYGDKGTIFSYEGTNLDDRVEVRFKNGVIEEFEISEIKFLN